MERVFKFIRKPGEAGQGKIFTHYWNNNMNNAFDDYSIEAYLSREYSHYKWEPTEAEDLNKTNLFYATLTISGWDEPVIFLKVETGEYDDQGIWTNTEIPTYYFGTELNSQTLKTETVVKTVYQLELDLWATVGWRFHLWTKQDFHEDILAFRKMCDRFMFNTLLGIGFSLDYRLQPYLMQTLNYSYPLIKDNTENSLTLNEWLYINSGEQRFKTMEDWLPVWYEWLNNPWCAPFFVGKQGGVHATSSYLDYVQNLLCMDISGGFNDEDYNSNGKYKWLIIKTGNNSTSALANNPVFPKTKYIQTRVGTGSTPFLTIPNATFTYRNNDAFQYDKTRGGYVITKTFQGTLDPEQTIPVGEKVIFNFGNTVFSTRFMKFNVINKETGYVNTFFVDNNLSRKHKNVTIDSFSFGVEYTIVEFETTSVIYAKDINLKVTPYLTLELSSSGLVTFRFRLYVENDLELGFTYLTYDFIIKNDDDFSTCEFNYFAEDKLIGSGEDGANYNLTGEELMYIPIKKGADGYEFIHKINSDNTYDSETQEVSGQIILSSGNVLGMPINDIPPSVLAMALRNFSNESEVQPIGDRISARKSSAMSPSECPLALLNFYSYYKESEQEQDTYNTPVIVNSLDYIPVNIAMSPQMFREYSIIGGTNFFNYFFDLLTNEYLTSNTYDEYGQLIRGGNTMESEPLLYGPQFWQWIYLIDGAHRIALTPDMIDFDKFIMKDWTVKLNVNMTDTTHYKLDISDIRSDIYPFTKSTSELISVDSITHPYSTEGFNNYMAYNQYTQETSKNAKDVQNYWAQRNLPIYQAGSIIGGLGEGVAGGAAAGGIWGAIAGGVGGLVGGVTEAITMKFGLENKISMVNDLWENQWKGTYGNLYSQPSSLNPSGFGSGSLLYSGVAKAKTNEYETFRTYRIVDLARREIWNDIASNGYIFRSQCEYADYDNRINFNMVNMNFDSKEAIYDNFLRQKIGEVSTMFSQQQFIDWFKMICKKGFRLWKKEPTSENINELIETNIENNYVRPWIPLSGYVVVDYNLPVFGIDNEIDEPELFSENYTFEEPIDNVYYLSKNDDLLTEYEQDIPYKFFGDKYVDSIVREGGKYVIAEQAREKFMEGFSGIRLNNDTSNVSLYNKTTGKMLIKSTLNLAYSSENIKLNELVYDEENDIYKTDGEVLYNVFDKGDDSFAELLLAQDPSSSNYVRASGFDNGWKVNVELYPTIINETTGEVTQEGYIKIKAKEHSRFKFVSPNWDIRGWTIQKKFSQDIDLSPVNFYYEDLFTWKSYWEDNWIWAQQWHVFMVGEQSVAMCQRGIQGKTDKDLGGAFYITDGHSDWSFSAIQDFASDVYNNRSNVVYINEWHDFADIEDIYLHKDRESSVKVNYKHPITVDVYGGGEKEMATAPGVTANITLSSSFSVSLTESQIESLKSGQTIIVAETHGSQTVEDSTGYDIKVALHIKFGIRYNVDEDIYKLCWSFSGMSRVDAGDIKSAGRVRTRWMIPKQNTATSTLIITKTSGDFQNDMWAQENKLNSFIFPKTSLIDESTSYILKHEKKSK